MAMKPEVLGATLLLLAPGLPARAAAPANPLAAAPSRFARLDGIKVHYKDLGRGKTALVFVHGWTCDLTFWRLQVPAFDGKARVVLIDLPGHGRSDKPKVKYDMDLFARAVHAVLKDAGVAEAVLVGHSMGTPVVRQFYRLYPKRTRALVVVDGMLKPPSLTAAQAEQFIARFTGPDTRDNIGKAVDTMFTKQAPAELRKEAKAVMQAAPQHVVAGALRGMMDPAIWKADPIKVPLLVVLAKAPHWNADYEKYVRKLAPKVDYRVMDGVGHFLMLEKPDEFNRILADFLKKQGLLKS